MGRTTELRQEIKKRFLPLMVSKGFSVDESDAPLFLKFKKIKPEEAYFCDIQWEKYGKPRFVLNFIKSKSDGTFSHRERLQPGSSRTTNGWFRQDKSFLNSLLSSSSFYSPEQVIEQLLNLFTEVEEFWSDGKFGKHIFLLPAGK